MKDGKSSARPRMMNGPFIIVSCFFLLLFCLLLLSPGLMIDHDDSTARAVCKENLSQIGKAIYAYSLDNGEYCPFDERGPLYSLALLYPKYLDDPKVFACPSARKRRWKRKLVVDFPQDTLLAGALCTYGYTWRVDPRASFIFAVMADMPSNHHDKNSGDITGFNVLYADGGVRWVQNPYCSRDPADNIFAPEPDGSPDTDAWIRQE